MTICCVCVFLVLMCTFFVENSHAAAQVKSGTSTKKEQTIKLTLSQGTCLITVKDADSWVFAQLQKTGDNKKASALNGDVLLANIGQSKSFTVAVKTAGTYYLYLRGVNPGATYSVQQYAAGGTLTSGKPLVATSYGDNASIVYYDITVPGPGALRVTVKDASYRYPGYSKVQLKKGNTFMSGEEHLIKGLGFSTVYGVEKGTYKIGIRSSSELYKVTATFSSVKPTAYGNAKSSAPVVAKGSKAKGVILPVAQEARWYRIDLPAGTAKRQIHVKALNNNRALAGGIAFTFSYKKKVDGKSTTVNDKHVICNDEQTFTFKSLKTKTRTIYVKAASAEGMCGTYTIDWK